MYKDDGQEFVSNRMTYNFRSKRRRLTAWSPTKASYLIGRDVKMENSETNFIENTQFTTCNNTDHPHFYLRLYKAKIIPNKKVIQRTLEYGDRRDSAAAGICPSVFSPPTRTALVILPPAYGESPRFGFFLQNGGYYWSINENIDLTLQGDITVGRLEAGTRHHLQQTLQIQR